MTAYLKKPLRIVYLPNDETGPALVLLRDYEELELEIARLEREITELKKPTFLSITEGHCDE